jgi:hypothetical protein
MSNQALHKQQQLEIAQQALLLSSWGARLLGERYAADAPLTRKPQMNFSTTITD